MLGEEEEPCQDIYHSNTSYALSVGYHFCLFTCPPIICPSISIPSIHLRLPRACFSSQIRDIYLPSKDCPPLIQYWFLPSLFILFSFPRPPRPPRSIRMSLYLLHSVLYVSSKRRSLRAFECRFCCPEEKNRKRQRNKRGVAVADGKGVLL